MGLVRLRTVAGELDLPVPFLELHARHRPDLGHRRTRRQIGHCLQTSGVDVVEKGAGNGSPAQRRRRAAARTDRDQLVDSSGLRRI